MSMELVNSIGVIALSACVILLNMNSRHLRHRIERLEDNQ